MNDEVSVDMAAKDTDTVQQWPNDSRGGGGVLASHPSVGLLGQTILKITPKERTV